MNHLLEQIREKNAEAFTHGGKFHADDVFSAALLLYLNPEISIIRGNKVPEDFRGVVFDIGRGAYDHHQKNSRVRENGVPYAAFGLLWEELGAEILGKELAEKFDESFVQPLDINDNTGEKNELAALIGNFNPGWDSKSGNDQGFFQAVSVAGMILENKFERYLGNQRADKRVEEILQEHEKALAAGDIPPENTNILVLSEFIPCQKRLSETGIAFVIFPSNRGGYCIQPQKKEYSMNYKCSFPSQWLGLEGEELIKVTGLKSAVFCHKGGFLMTCETLEDAILACRSSLAAFREEPVLLSIGGDEESDAFLRTLPDMAAARIVHLSLPELPDIVMQSDCYGEISMEKAEWKNYIKEQIKRILSYKPEAVFAGDAMFSLYPIVHGLRKKHIPILTIVEKDGKKFLLKIPSGS